jgi:hypothetical protein
VVNFKEDFSCPAKFLNLQKRWQVEKTSPPSSIAYIFEAGRVRRGYKITVDYTGGLHILPDILTGLLNRYSCKQN